jgi:hypothetical protein
MCNASGESDPSNEASATPHGEQAGERRKTMRHNERCRACKAAIHDLLKRAFATDVERESNLEMPARLQDYCNTANFEVLRKIFDSLKEHRGFNSFVRAGTVRGFDYYVPSARFVLEFDESQHFTAPRAIALSAYPSSLKVGFSVSDWINRCKQLDRHDNDPPDRDEQRAWLDALRDFAPSAKALHPLVRVFAGAAE